MASDDPVEVYAAKDTTEAYFLRNLLADAGIEAIVVGEPLGGVLGDVPFQAAAPRLWVRQADQERARAVVEEFGRRLIERSAAPPGSGDLVSDEQPVSEPFCYHCGQAVQVGQSPCPACGQDLDWGTHPGGDPGAGAAL